MAILTWQNVPILPPQSGAVQATRNAMDALGSLGDSLGGWAEGARERATLAADRNILGNMAGVQDPAEYARMLTAGDIIDGNLSDASPDMLRTALGYTDVLQKGADARYQSDRTRMLDANLDAASGQINDAMAYSALGLFPEAAGTLHKSKLHASHAGEWWDRIGRDQATEGRLEAARIRAGRGSEQYGDLKAARNFADEVYHVWKTDPSEGAAMIQRGVAEGRIDGNQASLVREALRESFENEFGPEAFKQRFGEEGALGSAPGAGGAQFGGNPSRGVLNSREVGGSGLARRSAARNAVVANGAIPQANGRVLNIHPEFLYGRPLEELSWDTYEAWREESKKAWAGADPEFLAKWGYSPGDGNYSTAAGKYQITGKNMDILRERGIIKESDGNPFSEAVQEKAARYLFEDAKRNGVPLHRVWPSLPDAFKDASFSRNVSFEDIAPYLALHEASGAPPRFDEEMDEAHRFLRDPNVGLSHEALALRRANETPDKTKAEVMQDLLANPAVSKMEKADPGVLEKAFNQLREINPNLTPSQIGAILSQAPRNPRWFGEDDAKNREALAASASDILQQVEEREEFERRVERLGTLRENYDRQLARYEQARQAAENASPEQKNKLELQRMKMLKELDDISKDIERNIGVPAARESGAEQADPAEVVQEFAAPAKERAQTAFDSSLERILEANPNLPSKNAIQQARGAVSRLGEDRRLIDLPSEAEVQALRDKQAVRAAGAQVTEALGDLNFAEMNAVEASAYIGQALRGFDTETLPSREVEGLTYVLLHLLGYEQGVDPNVSRQVSEPNMEVVERVFSDIVDRRLGSIDAAAQSAPVASSANKAPVAVDASETVRVGAQGAGEAVPPLEVDPADLGPSRTVVQGKRIPKGQTAKVIATFVEDGDTIDYGGDGFSGTCRLDFIDAAETAKPWKGQPEQLGAAEAKRRLQQMVENREVTVKVTDVDQYNRDVCQVEISGKDVSLELAKAGVAWVREEFVPRSDDRAMRILREFQSARDEGRGIFADPAAIAPWAFDARYR